LVRANRIRIAVAALLALCGAPAAAQLPATWDDLVSVKPKVLTAVYLLPGADFRPYRKVRIANVRTAFHKDWQTNVNRGVTTNRKITSADAERMANEFRASAGTVFADAFKAGGYEIVTEPAADVLELDVQILNLYVNAPVRPGGKTESIAVDAGEASLVLEARDSTTQAVLGRALDRRRTRPNDIGMPATEASNRDDFALLFKGWATQAVKGLEELKANSPVKVQAPGK